MSLTMLWWQLLTKTHLNSRNYFPEELKIATEIKDLQEKEDLLFIMFTDFQQVERLDQSHSS